MVMSLSLLALAFAYVNQARAASGSDAPRVASSEDSQTISITRKVARNLPVRDQPNISPGPVRIDPLFKANDPSRVFVAPRKISNPAPAQHGTPTRSARP